MTRRLVAFVVGICCMLSLGVGPAAASTPSSAFTRGAGLLPKLQHLGSTKMRLVVPKLPCTSKTPDASITVGMFGSTRRDGTDHAWSVGVRVTCTDGDRRAVANFNGFDHGGMHVHIGDVMVLKQTGGSDFSVADMTAGRGFGGSTASPDGSHPSPHVIFGGRLIGRLTGPVTVSVTNALVHDKPIGKTTWTGQQQTRKSGKVVGDPGPVSKNGRTFALTFS